MKTITDRISLAQLIRQDIGRLTPPANALHLCWLIVKHSISSRGFRAVLFYRITHRFQNISFLKNILFILNLTFNNIEISYTARIGPGLLIPHAQCIVIGETTVIGSNVTIQQGVTIGGNMAKIREGRKQPLIGSNVLIGAGAKGFGPVIVGDDAVIGANAVVSSDVPERSIAAGIPAKIIGTVKESYPETLQRLK